jgi:hypothetical protein
MREQFRRDGFVVVPRLLGPAEVEEWTVRLETASGLRRADFARRAVAAAGRRGLVGAWTMPDGVSRRRDFWPLVLHDRLLAAVREVVGTGACLLPHNDLRVGFSAPGWRREIFGRALRRGLDWDESREPYRIVRAWIHLRATDEGGSRLGVVPGTHRPGPATAERRRIESATTWFGRLCGLFTDDPVETSALWLRLKPGDCVLLDPRLLRAGTPLDGPAYSMVLAFGLPNGHYHRLRAQHRQRRAHAGQRDLDPELVALLQRNGLHAPEPAPDPRAARVAPGPTGAEARTGAA